MTTSDLPNESGFLRAAVIGTGQIAKQHLGALASCHNVKIVGICDKSPVVAEAAAERFGIESWFTDYRQLLDAQRPDVVHILTPPGSHFEIARDCLRSGAHVLVEKPITQQLCQLDELLEVAASEGKKLVEDHNYQFNREIQYMLALLNAGKFGQVRHVDVEICMALSNTRTEFADSNISGSQPRTVPGRLPEFLTHLCYLAYLFIGDYQTVSTSWRLSQDGVETVPENMQSLVVGKSATARLAFSSDIQPDSFTVRVHGTRMRMEANLFEVGVVATALRVGPKPLMPIRNMLGRSRAELFNAAKSLRRKLSGGPGPYEGLWELVRRFYGSLNCGTEPPVSADQIRAANRLFHTIINEAPVSCTC